MDKYEKLYNEALERFKSFKEKYYTKDTNLGDVIFDKNGEMQKDFNGIFPELRESEDERIRNEIIDHLVKEVGLYPGEDRKEHRWLRWLEKQKEQKVDIDKEKLIRHCIGLILTDATDKRFKDYGLTLKDCLTWLGEQKEQKPNIEICPHSIKSKSYKENGYPIENCDYGLEIAENILEKTLGKVEGYQSDDGIREHQTAIMAVKEAMKEQKPASTEDMPYITDEHFFEREPVDSFKYKLAKYMTRCCTKKEGTYGYEYGISAETILKMAEEELLKRGVVQKPVEWSRQSIIDALTKWLTEKIAPLHKKSLDGTITEREEMFRAALLEMRSLVNSPDFQIGKDTSVEWSEEDEENLGKLHRLLVICQGEKKFIPSDEYDKLDKWLKSLCPVKKEWSEEDEKMRQGCIDSVEYELLDNGMDDEVETDPRIVWLKSLRPQPKREIEWTEDDEAHLKWLCRIVHGRRVHKELSLAEESELGNWMDKWLNHSPQPKREWSVEERVLLLEVINDIKSLIDYDTEDKIKQHYEEEIAFLKSLRSSWKPSEVCYGAKGDPDPAGVWKPSEEQMEALNALNCHGDLSYVGQQNQLISLQKDLEKLKGIDE